jgi:hypothetical protein
MSIILKQIFKKSNGEAWGGLVWLRIGSGGGSLSIYNSKETSGSTKCAEFLG